MKLVVKQTGWPDIESTGTLIAGQATALAVEFAPASLTVTSEPSGAEIWEGAKKIGVTPASFSGLNAGAYRLQLRLTGHFPGEVSGRLAMSEAGKAHAALRADPFAGPTYTVPELGLEMVRLQPGSYQRGSDRITAAEKPVHTVVLTKAFLLGRYEVTQAEYRAITGASPSKFVGERRPVEQVSWDDAMAFCRKLTERERAAGRLPEGHEYTLPTEAQWEYACRAGTTGDYAGSLDAMAWYSANSGSQTQPVGQKQPNAWGLYDMHGNVFEWCFDWIDRYPSGTITDPTGAASGSHRVDRGGSYLNEAAPCRSAARYVCPPGDRHDRLGFRLALSSVR